MSDAPKWDDRLTATDYVTRVELQVVVEELRAQRADLDRILAIFKSRRVEKAADSAVAKGAKRRGRTSTNTV